jgi:hypothetical protein
MSLVNPSWLLPAIPVLVGSLTLMGLFVKQHQAVGTWIAKSWGVTWKRLCTKAAFFWFVNLVFMAVSVLHAGLFFALLEPANAFFGLAPLLGFAVALTLDLASIVFMQARLSALRMNEKRSAGWYLFSLMSCSGLSAFGNLAMSLEDFQPDSLNHAGSLIQCVAPWLGVAFPLLIILISIAADKVLDVNPTEHLDVEAYRNLEQKRIAILVERNNFLEQQVEQDRRHAEIKQREKESKRRKRGPSPEEQSPSPTELEHVMAQLQTMQEQVRQLSVASSARVSGPQEPVIAPPLPELTPLHLLSGQVTQPQQEQRPLTVGAPNEAEAMESFAVRFGLSYLDQHATLKQQVLDLFHQDPLTASERIITLVKQQDGLSGVTPALVSSLLARFVPSTNNGHLIHSSVDNRVNTGAGADVNTRRSVEETANGHLEETIPITSWRADGLESEPETGQTRGAEQTPMRSRIEQEKRPISDEPLTSQRTAVTADFKQETNQRPNGRVNSKTSIDQRAEEQWRAVEGDTNPSVNGHRDGQESDHSVKRSPDTAVNSAVSARADSEESTGRAVSEPSTEQHSEHPGEQEEQTKGTPEVNSAASTRVNTSPDTSVNSSANRPAKTPRRSSKGMAFTDKQRGEASQRVRRVLKKYPTASLSQLAEKAKVSRGYASQVRAQVLEEQQRQTSPGA